MNESILRDIGLGPISGGGRSAKRADSSGSGGSTDKRQVTIQAIPPGVQPPPTAAAIGGESAGAQLKPMARPPIDGAPVLEDEDIFPQDSLEHKPITPNTAEGGGRQQDGPPALADLDAEEPDDDDDDGESEDDLGASRGAYDPGEFAQLPVAPDVKELFALITDYQMQTVEIDPVLKPFLLDYIPAVGDIDSFVKIPRPDEVDDGLGLTVVDEPCARQTDPTVLDMQLRAVSKEAPGASGVAREAVVKRIGRSERNAKEIEQWVSSIRELHGQKPPTTVHYSRPMPDVDTLMQEWPSELEELLKQTELPSAEMDMPLEEYVDVVCALLDIPVHKSRIHALHLLFTLYSEFKNSQHFKSLAAENQLDNQLKSAGVDANQPADRLVL